MKLQTIWMSSLLVYLTFDSTVASVCDTTYFYKSTAVPIHYDSDYSWERRPFRVISCFPPRPVYGRLYKDAAVITCSNISPDVFLNYTYETQLYDQDLVIVNSTIPKFPSNSSLPKFTTIRKLILKNLGIEEVSPGAFDGLETLRSLDLSWNKLSKVPDGVFDTLSTLLILDLSNNHIKSVDRRSVSGLVTLKELYLNGNELTLLQDEVFRDLKVLEIFDVSNNPLEEFQDVGFSSVKKLLARNTYLRSFDVDLSNLTVAHCDLSGGQLEVINFDNFPSVQTFNLDDIRIRVLYNFDKLKSDKVYLNCNNISKLEMLPSKVKELDLSYNLIEDVFSTNLHQNSSLENLNLDFNQISKIRRNVFWGLQNLRVLKLRHNKIQIVEEESFVNCSNLESVDLSDNQIFYFQKNAFDGVVKLNLLNISHNNLLSINSAIMPEMNSLKKLYFDHNYLTWFDVEDFLRHFSSLKEVTINHNRWSCELLRDILHSFTVQNITIVDNTSVDEENVYGVRCEYEKAP